MEINTLNIEVFIHLANICLLGAQPCAEQSWGPTSDIILSSQNSLSGRETNTDPWDKLLMSALTEAATERVSKSRGGKPRKVSQRRLMLDRALNQRSGTSLVVQWLRPCIPNSGSWGLFPGLGTRSHTPQLRACAAK